MVSDITYIYVKNYGWTYIATVEDLCSRAIIGYSYGKTIDADLVIEAIKNVQKKGKFKEQAILIILAINIMVQKVLLYVMNG